MSIIVKIKSNVLLIGSALGVVQSFLRMGIGLVSVPITVSYLGSERYGLWMSTLSVLAVLNLLDVGIFPVIKNILTEAFAKNDLNLIKNYTSFALIISLLIILCGLIFLPIIIYFDWGVFFNTKSELARSEASSIALLIYIFTFINISLTFVDVIFASQQRIVVIQFFNMCSTVIGFILILICVYYKLGLESLVVSMLIPGILFRVYLFYLLSKSIHLFCFLSKETYFLIMRKVLPKSSSFLGIKFCEIIISALPSILIAQTIGLSSVSVFSITFRLVSIPLVLLSSVLPVFWPALSLAWTRGETVWIKKKLSWLLIFTFAIFIFYEFCCVLFGPAFILFWTKNAVSTDVYMIISISCLVTVQGLVYWLSTFLHSISDFYFQFICHLFVVLFLCMSSLIIKYYGINYFILHICFSWFVSCLVPMSIRVVKRLS